MSGTQVLGIVGWSGSGKTTLLTRLIPLLVSRGLRIATLKHAHHHFDVDQPGKDSYEHRKAGASEVIVSSARRWVADGMRWVMERKRRLPKHLQRLSPCRPGADRGLQDRAASEARSVPRVGGQIRAASHR